MPDDNAKPKPEYGLLEMSEKDTLSRNDFDDMVQGLAQKYLLDPFQGGSFTYERPMTYDEAQAKYPNSKAVETLRRAKEYDDRKKQEVERFAKKDALMRAYLEKARLEAIELAEMQPRPTVITGNWISPGSTSGISLQDSANDLFDGFRLKQPARGAKEKPTPAPSPAPEPLRKGRMVLLKDPE